MKYLVKILAKKLNQNSLQYLLSLKKINRLLLTSFTFFSSIDKILGKIRENANKNTANRSKIHKKWKRRILKNSQKLTLENAILNFLKSFYLQILRLSSFLMMPVSTIYDENIDRPKFSEQKTTQWRIKPQEVTEQKNTIHYSESEDEII